MRAESLAGKDFLRSVEACVRGIQRHPEMYPAAIDEFRRAPIRRFPFEIFFEFTVDSITLYFTAHKIHKSGASVSAIEHTRLNIGPTADPSYLSGSLWLNSNQTLDVGSGRFAQWRLGPSYLPSSVCLSRINKFFLLSIVVCHGR